MRQQVSLVKACDFRLTVFLYLGVGLQRPFWTGRLGLFQDARDTCPGDREGFGDLADALAVDALP